MKFVELLVGVVVIGVVGFWFVCVVWFWYGLGVIVYIRCR